MRRRTSLVARAVEPGLGLVDRAVPDLASVTFLGWHRLDDGSGGLSVSPGQFRAQLDVIEEWGGTVVSLEEALSAPAARLPLRAVVLTFDDGYASAAEVGWPLLQARRWPATMYAVSGFGAPGTCTPWDAHESRPPALLTSAALADLDAEGFRVESHTVTHRLLPTLSDTDLAAETRRSRVDLEDLLGRPVRHFAYPAGHHDDRVRAAVADAGYDSGLTTARGRHRRGQDELLLRRTIVPRTATDLQACLVGAYSWLRPIDRFREQRLMRRQA